VDDIGRWLLGLTAATLVAYTAFRADSLNRSGAPAAAATGAIAVAAGWGWGLLLVAYFVSSAALGRFRAGQRASRVLGLIEKDGPRDALQVAANGGVFVLAAVGWLWRPDPLWQTLAAAALGASAADTWATEIGTLARATPRSIVDWSVVAPGTSGGITLQGSLGALAGAAFIGLMAWLVRWPNAAVAAAIVGGVAGCLIDSLIGATFQSRRRCDTCQQNTEMRVHTCGRETRVTGGWSWLTNDGVNAVSTVAGALVGAPIARVF